MRPKCQLANKGETRSPPDFGTVDQAVGREVVASVAREQRAESGAHVTNFRLNVYILQYLESVFAHGLSHCGVFQNSHINDLVRAERPPSVSRGLTSSPVDLVECKFPKVLIELLSAASRLIQTFQSLRVRN